MRNFKRHLLYFLIIALILFAYSLLKITCPIKFIFGIECPACKMTRSTIALLKFDFRNSLSLNPMTVPVIIAVFLAFHKKLFKYEKLVTAIVIFIAIMTFIVYVLRFF